MVNEQYVQFDVVKEDYTICEIENGQILKTKQAITDVILLTLDDRNTRLNFGAKQISAVETPIKIDTHDIEVATVESVTEKDEIRGLKFKIIKRPTCIYESETFLILCVTDVIKVSLTNKKDKSGNPILRFVSEQKIAVVDKPKFETK